MAIMQAFTHRPKLPIQFTGGAFGTQLFRPTRWAVSTTTTITIPAHQQGDLILAIGTNQGVTAPSISTAGWSILATRSGGLAARQFTSTLAYKFGQTGASETCTFFGSGIWGNISSSCMIFRNVAGIGALSSFSAAAEVGNFSLPSLSLQMNDGTSAVVCMVAHPYISSTNIAGSIVNFGSAYFLNRTNFPGGDCFLSAAVPAISFSIELLI
jgi:hypothetical protein